MLKTLFTLGIGLLTFSVIAQDTNSTILKIKDFSLRDYEAPDIKYKQLNLGTRVDGSGNQIGNSNRNQYGGNLNGNFSTYINNEGYQGRNRISLNLYWDGQVDKDTARYDNRGTEGFSLSYYATNRMYVSEKHFFAVHPRVYYSHSLIHSVRNNGINSGKTKAHIDNVNVTTTLSVGSGRIQPIAPAREALNILISMRKYNRLASVPDSAKIDSLAKVANSIIYKRFYDSRFKRVYQLEELDKGLQELGLVTNPDMVYAANLSDIWNYGMNYFRGAGSVWEMGLIPNIRYYYTTTTSNANAISESVGSENSILGGFGFLSWSKQTPINFQLQSDLSIRILAGYADSKQNMNGYSYNFSDTNTMVSQSLSVNYGFGFYPNTRTQIRVGASADLATNQIQKTTTEMKDEYIGLRAGVDLVGYYYVSPRFRLELTGDVKFLSDDYINNDPVYSYTENLTGYNRFNYSYRLGINYAIF